MSEFSDILRTTGKGLKTAGLFVAGQARDLYRKIDPDVPRHLVQIPLLSYSLLVSRRETIEPGESDGHPPLIFVHGLGGNRGNFLLMAWWLRAHGRKRSYKIAFEPGQSIDEMAAALAQFVEEVRTATGEERVEIVAHSLGGIVARLALNEHGLQDRIRTLVTLGTPHHGTYPARYANTETTRDLRPDSELIRRLNAKPWPASVRGVTFWSRNDLFVLPAESAALQGTEIVDATPFTHYSYLIDFKAFKAVTDLLAGHTLSGLGS